MREPEAFLTIAMIGGSVAAIAFGIWHKERRARRKERHELLRQALNHPQLDELTRAELVRALAREQHFGWPRLASALRTSWLAAGWMMFIIGGGMALLAAMNVVRGSNDVMAGVALFGFAMLSLPLGLRELTRRDGAAASQRGA